MQIIVVTVWLRKERKYLLCVCVCNECWLVCLCQSWSGVCLSPERWRRIWRKTPGNRSRISCWGPSAARSRTAETRTRTRTDLITANPALDTTSSGHYTHHWPQTPHSHCFIRFLIIQFNAWHHLFYKNHWFECLTVCVCVCLSGLLRVWWRAV